MITGKMKNSKGAMALSQILILLISIIAISYAIGSEVKGVSSFVGDECSETNNKFTYGGQTYTVISKTKITGMGRKSVTDEWEFHTYTLTNGVWKWEDGTIVSTTSEPGFYSSAEKCIKEISEKTDTPTTSYDEGIDEYGYPSETDTTSSSSINPTSLMAAAGIFGSLGKEKEPAEGDPDIGGDPSTGKEGEESEGMLGGLFNVKKGGFMDGILTGFEWGAIVYFAVKYIGPMLGLEQELVDASSIAAAAGVLIGKAVGIWSDNKKLGVGLGVATGVALFIIMYKKESQEVITFTCYPWDAETGGENCEKCNKQGILPCSEYQCRSLGQACQLLNQGTDEEKCVWVNKNDVKFPTIEPWENVLPDGYEYRPDNAIAPPDRGVVIWNTASSTGCAKAFTPLSFGATLDEPAKCKIDGIRKKSFDDMDFYFSESLSLYNHSYSLSLPGPRAFEAENITIGGEGEYGLYVKCQDANGNANTADFVFRFCVEKGPDTTPPLIVTTDPLNNMPIAYNQSSVDTSVYVNEPAECRWSHTDQDYSNMEEDMSCSSSIFEMNAQMLYTCDTTLTGLKDRQENKFYFRCKDTSENTNKESYKFSLIGTQPLVIDWAKPESGSIIKDSTDAVKVTLEAKTSAGYNEGEATCYYSETGITEDYVTFFNTGSHQHSQELWLPEKDEGESYEYFIKCIDLGGNSDIEVINFEIESDSSSPIVVRAYHEETYLKLITNEPSRCVYDTKYENLPCDYSFDDGTPMTNIEDINHYTDWNTQITFYVVCQDEYGTQPAYGECSKIIRPSEIY